MSAGGVLLSVTLIGHACFIHAVCEDVFHPCIGGSHWADIAYVVQSAVAIFAITLLI